MATHSSILAWRIPPPEDPRGLQSMGLRRVGHNWVTNTHTHPFWGWIIEGHVAPSLLVRMHALAVFSPLWLVWLAWGPHVLRKPKLPMWTHHTETLRLNGEKEKENCLASPQPLQLPEPLTTCLRDPRPEPPSQALPQFLTHRSYREYKRIVAINHPILDRCVPQKQVTRTEANFISLSPTVTLPSSLQGTVPVAGFCLA